MQDYLLVSFVFVLTDAISMNELKQFLAGEFEWGSVDNVKRIFEVNVFGVIRVTKAFLPLIRKSKGRIVNLASVAGRLTGIGNLLIFFK